MNLVTTVTPECFEEILHDLDNPVDATEDLERLLINISEEK